MSKHKTRDDRGRFAKSNGKPVNSSQPTLNSEQMADILFNAVTTRSQLLKQYTDPRRDIDVECGYPKTENLSAAEYRDMYDREAVAARVVEVLPKESWVVQPTVYETEDVDQDTAFEQVWRELGRTLRKESWFQDEKGSPIWEHLLRADILSGVGSFGVLLIGIDDGADLREPIQGINDDGSGVSSITRKLLYLRSFDESLVDITRYEGDITSPRFGHPIEYSITFNDPNDQNRSGIGLPNATVPVHWTRVIHLADNLGSSEIFGVPRMRPVYNRIYDLRKLYSGSAEMYWQGAFPGLSFETHPQLGGDVSIDASTIRTQMEYYITGLQRYLATLGMTVKSLSPQVVDPTPQINTQIEAICIRLGIPKRIFMGSERGELASTQDTGAWNDRLQDRQNMYVTPRIIAPFVDRLVQIGVLPEPEGYSVQWPDLEMLTEEQKAIVAAKRTEALAKYIQGGVEAIITPLDYLVRVLEVPQNEAEAIIEAAVEAVEAQEAEQEAMLEEPTNPLDMEGEVVEEEPVNEDQEPGGA